MDILERIEAMRTAVLAAKTEDDARALWHHCESIETDLLVDPHTTDYEKQTVERLKDAQGAMVRVAMKGGKAQNVTGPISVALTTLKHSIERRTTGPDGFPFRS